MESTRSNRNVTLFVAFQSRLRILVPEDVRTVGANGAESVVDRVERDGVAGKGVRWSGLALRRFDTVKFECEIGLALGRAREARGVDVLDEATTFDGSDCETFTVGKSFYCADRWFQLSCITKLRLYLALRYLLEVESETLVIWVAWDEKRVAARHELDGRDKSDFINLLELLTVHCPKHYFGVESTWTDDSLHLILWILKSINIFNRCLMLTDFHKLSTLRIHELHRVVPQP